MNIDDVLFLQRFVWYSLQMYFSWLTTCSFTVQFVHLILYIVWNFGDVVSSACMWSVTTHSSFTAQLVNGMSHVPVISSLIVDMLCLNHASCMYSIIDCQLISLKPHIALKRQSHLLKCSISVKYDLVLRHDLQAMTKMLHFVDKKHCQ